MRLVVKEVSVFLALFVILALSMHFKAWLDHPIRHLEALPKSPLGPWHPLYLTFAAYLILAILRVLVYFFKKLLSRSAN